VTRIKPGDPILSTPPRRERDSNLRLYVVFTDFEATQAAIQSASHLARDLKARIVLLVAKVVPFPLPLESPPVPQVFTNALLSRLAAGLKTDVTVRVYLCRDRDETIRNVLERGALVVIGRRKRWWPTGTPVLGRRLQQDGHQVVFAGFQSTQSLTI
jgi:hypothetical protein